MRPGSDMLCGWFSLVEINCLHRINFSKSLPKADILIYFMESVAKVFRNRWLWRGSPLIISRWTSCTTSMAATYDVA